MNIANEILETIKEDVEDIIDSTDWNTKGISPEKVVSMIEVKGMLTNVCSKIDKVIHNKLS